MKEENGSGDIQIRFALVEREFTMNAVENEFSERRRFPCEGACPEELEAFRFVKAWHRHPLLHDALWYQGVNLGELDEYILFSPVLKVFLRQSGRLE